MPGEPGRAELRRAVLVSLLRAGASVTLVAVVYFVAPLDRPLGPSTWVGIGLALTAFAMIVAWLARAILAAELPRLRAAEAVATGLPLLVLLFAATYVRVSSTVPTSFSEELTRVDAIYFTVTVFATVGFGDIAPVSQPARILTTAQMVVGVIVVGVVARVLLRAVQFAERRREPGGPAGDGTAGGDTTRGDTARDDTGPAPGR